MSEYRELSRLPVNPEYWEDLESRIVADIAVRMRAKAWAGGGLWGPLAARAWPLGGLAVAAMFGALLLVPPREPSTPASLDGLLRVPEEESLLAAFLAAPAPPDVASLVIADAEAR